MKKYIMPETEVFKVELTDCIAGLSENGDNGLHESTGAGGGTSEDDSPTMGAKGSNGWDFDTDW